MHEASGKGHRREVVSSSGQVRGNRMSGYPHSCHIWPQPVLSALPLLLMVSADSSMCCACAPYQRVAWHCPLAKGQEGKLPQVFKCLVPGTVSCPWWGGVWNLVSNISVCAELWREGGREGGR